MVRAQALAHLGETDQALEAVQQALRLNPDNSLLAYGAAVVYVVIGDRRSALFHARRAALSASSIPTGSPSPSSTPCAATPPSNS